MTSTRDRRERFELALRHIREWVPPDTALEAVGVNPGDGHVISVATARARGRASGIEFEMSDYAAL